MYLPPAQSPSDEGALAGSSNQSALPSSVAEDSTKRWRGSAAEVTALVKRQRVVQSAAASTHRAAQELAGAGNVRDAKVRATPDFSIHELDHEEVVTAIEELRDDLDEMGAPPANMDKKTWDFRLDKTNELLDMIEAALPGLDPDKDKVLGYAVEGKVKGMLVLENKAPPSIYAFVTHPDPAIRGAGRALVAQAKQVSASAMNGAGALQLLALNPLAEAIYQHWGFTVDPLDPKGKRMTSAGLSG